MAIPSSDVGDQYPGFAAYVYVTNWALGIVEAGQDVRELWRHVDRIAKADCPSGHEGDRGEVWLARVLPPPAASRREAIVVTTPYVIQNPGPAGWQTYLDRTLPKIASDPKLAYRRLMKHGLDERFWLEYVFEAYASHRVEAVFLMGLPDLPESRPHSRINEDRHLLGVGG